VSAIDRRGTILLAPALAVFAVFFLIPVGFFFIVSFWQLKFYNLVPAFSFENYGEVYREYLHAGIFTFAIALTIATVTTIIAFLLAYLIRFRAGRYGPALLFVVMITLFGGYLVKIYAWKTILGTQGIVNTGLMAVGIIDEPIAWILYSPHAVVLTLVHFLLPFAVLPIYGALRGIADDPLEAARDLGASPFRVLVDIVLPQAMPGLIAGFALAFLISAGDYVTPRLVGGTNTFMVGNFIESQFVNRLNAPVGSALSFSVLAACLVTLAAATLLARRLLRPR
jgi:spermidine/putrescine transport system permease protein